MSGSLPKANEAAWYDEHYRLIQNMGPWHKALLPELVRQLSPDSRLVELGCGQGHILDFLVSNGFAKPDQLFGLDQSQTAVEIAQKKLPGARIQVGDIYQLQYGSDTFDLAVLLETIEHLEEPSVALKEINRVLKPGAKLFVSFPNYLHLPWLAVRLLAEWLNRPNWVVLQPIDKIYTVFGVIRLFEQNGFKFLRGIGSNYGPPVFYPLETDGVTRTLNRMRLWRFSFHPVLLFQKNAGPE